MRKILIFLDTAFLFFAFSCVYAGGLPWKEGPGEFRKGEFHTTVIENAVLILHLDEGAGTTASDASGYGNNGTLSASSWADGKYGKALNANGASITVQDANSLDLTTGMTILCWLKYTTASSDYLSVLDKGSQNCYFLRRDNTPEGEKITAFINVGGSVEPRVNSGYVPVLNEWFHVGVTFDGSTLKIYINGELKGSSTRSGSIIPNASPLTIGGSWPGLIDEVKIYNRAFTADEIKADYGGQFLGVFNSPGGDFTSSVYDCEDTFTFGQIAWIADVPEGCTLSFYTSTSPDRITWTETGPYRVSGSVIANPPARYIKYRVNCEFAPGAPSSAQAILKEVVIYPAVKGFKSSANASPSLKIKNGDLFTLDIDFNVKMDTNNGKCAVTLIDGLSQQWLINDPFLDEGTWIDSQHFQTRQYTVTTGIGGGFASLIITGPNVLGASGNLYSYIPGCLLVDEAELNPPVLQFFPNPFSPNGDGKAEETTLLLMLDSPKNLTVRIYDLKGRPVRTLIENELSYGNGIVWDGKDEQGRPCPVGIYVYQLKMDGQVKSGTVVLSK